MLDIEISGYKEILGTNVPCGFSLLLVAIGDSFVLSSSRRSYLPPWLMAFVLKYILTDEKTNCHFLSTKTVREVINFYT